MPAFFQKHRQAKSAGLRFWSLMKNLKSHTLLGYVEYSADEAKCQYIGKKMIIIINI